MKRISFWMLLIAVACVIPSQAQDAATEERLNKLSGQIEDLIAGQRAQQKQLEALAKEIEALREHANKPTGTYATPDDVKRVADALREVDRKRMEDSERISTQLTKLGKTLAAPAPAAKKQNPASNQTADNLNSEKTNKDDKGYPYTIQSGDTLSVIVQAYREKNIKVTTDQILKANPGLKADKLRVGQKIWIPAPEA